MHTMLKFAIVSREPENVAKIREMAERLGFEMSSRPEFVISIGGDGTFLRAEEKYPGIPKLLIRDSNVCQKCDNLEYDEMFMCLAGEEYRISEHRKLEAKVNGTTLLATNDISVRNRIPIHAIRFTVTIGQDVYPLIGDGVVISSAFGSTGYFYSITKKRFSKGIGVAFNNVTSKIRPRILRSGAEVAIKLFRHDADLTADNHIKVHTLKEGQTIRVKLSDKTARIIHVRPKRWHLPFHRRRKR